MKKAQGFEEGRRRMSLKGVIWWPHSGRAEVLQLWKKFMEMAVFTVLSAVMRLVVLGRKVIVSKSAEGKGGLTFGAGSVPESVKVSQAVVLE